MFNAEHAEMVKKLQNMPEKEQQAFRAMMQQMVGGEKGASEMTDQELKARMQNKLKDIGDEKHQNEESLTRKEYAQQDIDQLAGNAPKKQEAFSKFEGLNKGFFNKVDYKEDEAKAQSMKTQGNVAYKEKDFDKALDYYSKAIALDPYNHVHYSNRATVNFELKKYEKCAEDANISVNIKHTWIKGWYRLGQALYELKNYNGCKQALYGGLGIAPNNVEMKALLDKLPKEKEPEFTEEQEKGLKDYTKKKNEEKQVISEAKNGIDPSAIDDSTLKLLSENEKVKVLCRNPEYLTALTSFMQDPTGVLKQYGNDPNFMGAIQEFAHLTGKGDVFEAAKPKKMMTREEMQDDDEVQDILSDPKVKMIFGTIQAGKGNQVDLKKIAAEDPECGKKIDILVKKGVIAIND